MATAAQPITTQAPPTGAAPYDPLAGASQATGLSPNPSWFDSMKSWFHDFHTMPSLEFDKKYAPHHRETADAVRSIIPFADDIRMLDDKLKKTKVPRWIDKNAGDKSIEQYGSEQLRGLVEGMAQPGSFGAAGGVMGMVEGGARGIIEGQGLKYKGELTPGSDVHMFEHPDHPGKTAALEGKLLTPESVTAKMLSKLEEFGISAGLKALGAEAKGKGKGLDFSSIPGHVKHPLAEVTKHSDIEQQAKDADLETLLVKSQGAAARANATKPLLDFSDIPGHQEVKSPDELNAATGPQKKQLKKMGEELKEAAPELAKSGFEQVGPRQAPKGITTPAETFEHPAPTKPLAANESTEQAWRDERSGEWSPARAQWHDKIADSFLKGKTPVESRKPQAIILGGGQGAGKTRLSKQLMGDNPNIVRIDADELKLLIPEYEKLKETDPKTAAMLVHEESSFIAKKIMARAAANKFDVIYDATSSGSGGVTMVKTLAGEGYDVHLRFADVPTDIARNRAVQRAADPDSAANYMRHPPPGSLEESHRKSASNYVKMHQMPEVSTAQLYDTRSGANLVHSREAIGNEVVHDKKLWGAYGKKAAGEPLKLMSLLNDVKKMSHGQTSHWTLLAERGHQGITDSPFTADEKELAASIKADVGPCKVGYCYMNAQRLATSTNALDNPKVRYVEGLVTVHGVPLEHAWLEVNGKVYDPTLLDTSGKPKGKVPMPEYVGVEVPKDEIWKNQHKTGAYSPLSMRGGDEKLFEKIWGVKPSWGRK